MNVDPTGGRHAVRRKSHHDTKTAGKWWLLRIRGRKRSDLVKPSPRYESYQTTVRLPRLVVSVEVLLRFRHHERPFRNSVMQSASQL
jgi:hypothetical protein